MSKLEITQYLKSTFYMDTESLVKFCNTAPHRYKVYSIPKKNGKGSRTIAQPSKEVKILQRQLLKLLIKNLPIHNASFAYSKGKNIKQNAEFHKDSNYLLKLDLSNFFNSITPDLLKNQFKNHNINLTEQDFHLLSNLIFWRSDREKELILSVGAPTSPFISNFIMYNFDRKMIDLCKKFDCKYSRYADDITISSINNFYDINLPKIIRKSLQDEFNNILKLNNTKTKFISKAHKRIVTGIVLSNNNNISIGYKNKRLLSTQIHHFKCKIMTEDKKIMKLKGNLSFAFHIQPTLREYFIKKYGFDTIDSILKH